MGPGPELNATAPPGAGPALRLALAAACGLILLVGFTANGLMLLVVGRGPRGPVRPLLALTNSLMVNITLSDLLFLACVVPVQLLSFLRAGWWLGPALCTASQAANTATMFCTFYSMVATALLRHAAVARPPAALPAGPAARLLLCGAMWALGLAASLPNWLFQGLAGAGPGALACLLLRSPPQTSCYFALLGALAFLPCALGLGCSFSHVGWLLRTQPRGPTGESVREHRENTGLMLTVLGVFVLMWGPCSVLGYLSAVGALPDTLGVFVASSLCTILAYSNCAVSPILCFYLSRPFRAGLQDLLRLPRAPRPPGGGRVAAVGREHVLPGLGAMAGPEETA
ncbi:allatostatin-A receptor-like [Sorex araneus]|uniref:allatostatin-A receptor-like n=1 Tax=Sorex araneus TaxID=42254 RepID=UPI002433BB71|nr:allatostatin-A receptor-like [Sorex araneus]